MELGTLKDKDSAKKSLTANSKGAQPIKSILLTLPQPKNENSPYLELTKKHDIRINFFPFIHVQGVTLREYRDQKVNIENYDALLLTSKHAVDNYFNIAEQLRYEVPAQTKYFCLSESIALYLQKYVRYRKRRIFFGNGNVEDLLPSIQKFPESNILAPTSDTHSEDSLKHLLDKGILVKKVVFFKTVFDDLSELKDVYYDMIVFYTPLSVDSLFQNFPDFQQEDKILVAYGLSTQKALEDRGLEVNMKVPTENFPSVVDAIGNFVEKNLSLKK